MKSQHPWRTLAVPVTLVLVAAALAGCTNNTPPAAGDAGGRSSLLGDGSTFVAPLMDKWRTTYAAQEGGLSISYTGGGSGKGRTDISNRLVDFAGSDAPMKDSEIANATDILHIPVAAGGVAIAYNLPALGETRLKFSGEVLAKIFLGTITKWNDPALVLLNPGIPLPNGPIALVHRSDGSGTTATFTDYLSKVSPEWRAGPGSGSSVNWPAGTGANGNAGVGTAIQQEEFALGYIGSEWSDISKITTGLIQNKAGEFVAATPTAVSAALDAGLVAGAFDERLRGSVTNMDGPQSYPIAAVTWVLVHQEQTSAGKGKALSGFLWYTIHEGQKENEPLSYARIPSSLIAKAEGFIDSMHVGGQKLR